MENIMSILRYNEYFKFLYLVMLIEYCIFDVFEKRDQENDDDYEHQWTKALIEFEIVDWFSWHSALFLDSICD